MAISSRWLCLAVGFLEPWWLSSVISWSWLQVHGRGSHDSHGILLTVFCYTAICRRIPATVDGFLRRGPGGLPGGLMNQPTDLLKGEELPEEAGRNTTRVSEENILADAEGAEENQGERSPYRINLGGTPDSQSTKPTAGPAWRRLEHNIISSLG